MDCGGKMKVILKNEIKNISQQTRFSYREVYVLSLFVDFDFLEFILRIISDSGMGVGEYLLNLGIPQSIIYGLLHGEAQYEENREV